MGKSIKHITIATYAHPELYPPVLSAIDELSKDTEKIDVITRKTLVSKWHYPDNVKLNYINNEGYTGFGIENIPIWKKIYHFLKFVYQLKKIMKHDESRILIVHDVIPLHAAYILRKQLKKQKIKLWYHNHDVTDRSKSGKFSLMGIASKYENKAFEYIDIFTLPAKERLQYFPVEKLNTAPIILPNYPLARFYNKAKKFEKNVETNTLKLVFQGSIGAGHGLEELLDVLSTKINGKQLELHLVGKVRENYLNHIENLAHKKGVKPFFKYHGMMPFAELPTFLSQFDIGLAIHKPYNVTYATGGTASNKIYEYAACGFPVILFDNEHYRSYLEDFNWTFFTDLSKVSFIHVLEKIDTHLKMYSLNAYSDFEKKFNFEIIFKEQIVAVLKKCVLKT